MLVNTLLIFRIFQCIIYFIVGFILCINFTEYNTKNEKDAGPSNLDDGYETIPQGKMYDCTLNTDTGHFRYHLFAIDKVVGLPIRANLCAKNVLPLVFV